MAYTIVKTIFDKKADLVAVHQEAKNFKLEIPGQGQLADSVASRRGEIFRRKGREDVSVFAP